VGNQNLKRSGCQGPNAEQSRTHKTRAGINGRTRLDRESHPEKTPFVWRPHQIEQMGKINACCASDDRQKRKSMTTACFFLKKEQKLTATYLSTGKTQARQESWRRAPRRELKIKADNIDRAGLSLDSKSGRRINPSALRVTPHRAMASSVLEPNRN
jgi:hypothetical protein